MARTLLDLFNDPDSFKYGTDYNNEIKDKPQSSGFVAGIRNYVEQESNGLRIKAAKSIVGLYGTELVRITKKRTNLVDDMKVATGGRRREGLIGSITRPLKNLKDKIGDILGFPDVAIPTFVVEEGSAAFGSGKRLFTSNRGREQDTMELLGDIKKDAAGSGLGRFIKQNAKGTPKQILKSATGSAINAGKKAVRGALFGRGTTLGSNNATQNSDQGTIYGSSTLLYDLRYSTTMEDSTQFDSEVSPLINIKLEDDNAREGSLAAVKALAAKAPKASDIKKLTAPKLNLNKKPNIGSSPTTLPKVPKFTPGNTQVYGKNEDEGEYSYSQTIENNIQRESVDSDILFGRPSDLDGKVNNWLDETKLSYSGYNAFNTKRKNDRNVDYLTNSNGYKYKDKANLKKIFDKGRIITDENIDTIIVKIGDIRFHFATITGISENLSPSWTGFRMIGSPFSSYIYDSIERTVGFSLKLYASNPLEHKQNWDNINKLSKLVYPLGYIGEAVGAIQPPITNLTLGDMYIDKFGFIESLSYTIDDDSTWELGRGQTEIDEYAELFAKTHSPYGGTTYDSLQTTDSVAWDAVQGLAEVVNYKLPKMIDISVTFKFIESRNDSEQAVIYAFKPAT
jgi:hypothetical protein